MVHMHCAPHHGKVCCEHSCIPPGELLSARFLLRDQGKECPVHWLLTMDISCRSMMTINPLGNLRNPES